MIRSRLPTQLWQSTRLFGVVKTEDIQKELENPNLFVIDIRSELEVKGGVIGHQRFLHLPLMNSLNRLVTDRDDKKLGKNNVQTNQHTQSRRNNSQQKQIRKGFK